MNAPRTDKLANQPMTINDITPPYPVLQEWERLCRELEERAEKAEQALALRGEPVAWGLPNTAITGKKQALMMVSLEVPSDDQYGGAMWVPLVLGAAR